MITQKRTIKYSTNPVSYDGRTIPFKVYDELDVIPRKILRELWVNM